MDDWNWRELGDALPPWLQEVRRKMEAQNASDQQPTSSAKRLVDFERHAEESQWFA